MGVSGECAADIECLYTAFGDTADTVSLRYIANAWPPSSTAHSGGDRYAGGRWPSATAIRWRAVISHMVAVKVPLIDRTRAPTALRARNGWPLTACFMSAPKAGYGA